MANLAVCGTLGGHVLSDLSILRCQDEIFGAVASNLTVSRLVKALAGDIDAVEAAVNQVRKAARQRAWGMASEHSPTTGISTARPLVIDIDAP